MPDAATYGEETLRAAFKEHWVQGILLYSCRECGALVGERWRHLDWHRDRGKGRGQISSG